MKQALFTALLSATLLTACATNQRSAETEGIVAAQRASSDISPELLDRLSELLSKNQDLRTAYLVMEPGTGNYVLVPTFDGSPNMTSLYEALDLFKEFVPSSQLNLALLPPSDLKRFFGQSAPFYVRP